MSLEPIEELIDHNLNSDLSVFEFTGNNFSGSVEFCRRVQDQIAMMTLMPSSKKFVVKLRNNTQLLVYPGEYLAITQDNKIFVYDPLMYVDEEEEIPVKSRDYLVDVEDLAITNKDLRTEGIN
jgi:hypothetical protein